MSGSSFINAMQWWNDELQTSHLRDIERSLNSNLSALRQAHAQSFHDAQAQNQKIEAAKNSIFYARKLVEEARAQFEEQPNNALFLYLKLTDAMRNISDTDFSELSDKEYFFNVEKNYKNLGEDLKKSFGDDYIYHLKHRRNTYQLYLYLHNIALAKEFLTLSESDNCKGFFGGFSKDKLRDGISAIARERGTRSATAITKEQTINLNKMNLKEWRNNLEVVIDDLIALCCKYDHYNLVDPENLHSMQPSDMNVLTDQLESVSQEIVDKSREYLGMEYPFIAVILDAR